MTKNLVLFLMAFSAAPIYSMQLTKAEYGALSTQKKLFNYQYAINVDEGKLNQSIIDEEKLLSENEEKLKKYKDVEGYLDDIVAIKKNIINFDYDLKRGFIDEEIKLRSIKEDSIEAKMLHDNFKNSFRIAEHLRNEKKEIENKKEEEIKNLNEKFSEEKMNKLQEIFGWKNNSFDNLDKDLLDYPTRLCTKISLAKENIKENEKKIKEFNLKKDEIKNFYDYRKKLAESTEEQIAVVNKLGNRVTDVSFKERFSAIDSNDNITNGFFKSERMVDYKAKVITPLLGALGNINTTYVCKGKTYNLKFDLTKNGVLQSSLNAHMTLPEVINGKYTENNADTNLNITMVEQANVMKDYLDIYGLDFDESAVVGNKIILKFKPKAPEQTSSSWKKHNKNYDARIPGSKKFSDDSWHITIVNDVDNIYIEDGLAGNGYFDEKKFKIGDRDFFLEKIKKYIDGYVGGITKTF